jgi:hypothetical protein
MEIQRLRLTVPCGRGIEMLRRATVNSDVLGGVRNLLRQYSFWLRTPDLNLRNLSRPHICSRGMRVTHPYCPEWMLLSDFWCHFWWHLDCQFQATCGALWRAEFFTSL